MIQRILLSILGLAAVAVAANIDGKWISELELRGRRGAAAQGQKVEVILDLHSQGDQLQGTAAIKARKRSRETPILDGKLEGDRFSFHTIQKGQQGEVKMNWSGVVSGEELRGERTREGAKRPVPFTAKRK